MEKPKRKRNRKRIFVSVEDEVSGTSQSKGAFPKAPFDVLSQYLRSNAIGHDATVNGPFGTRPLVYCDYTASGRALEFIENFIRAEVLPLYANTHTNTSLTGKQTTFFREEARALLKRYFNAQSSKGSPKDCLIFTGSGSTGAIQHLVRVLQLDALTQPSDSKKKPIVFVSSYEHHSNLLPWRQAGCIVVQVPNNPETGTVCLSQLRSLLQKYQDHPVKIGSFSACSNVTGVMTDDISIAIELHRFNALAMFDCASCAPYVPLDMNPVITDKDDGHLAYKDAMFISPHKLPGGVSTPGILIAKKKLFKSQQFEATPGQHLPSSEPGGGTVFFVTDSDHTYASSVEVREEGGTPDIVGSIRCALAFQFQDALGRDNIFNRCLELTRLAIRKLRSHPNIHLLGGATLNTASFIARSKQHLQHEPNMIARLPIFSFMIRHEGTLLHYNFVSALLNDLFGIQSRGGCACAGPYAQQLMNMSHEVAKRYEDVLLNDDLEVLRPGFVRVNLSPYATEEEIDYVIKSILWLADHGWKLLPLYTFNELTGEWYHYRHRELRTRRWLGHVQYGTGEMKIMQTFKKETPTYDFESFLDSAQQQVDQTVAIISNDGANSDLGQRKQSSLPLNDAVSSLKWFLFPSEAYEKLSTALSSSASVASWSTNGHSTDVVDIKSSNLFFPPHQNTNVRISLQTPSPVANTQLNSNISPETVIVPRKSIKPTIPRKLIGPVLRAIQEHQMIRDGDRVLLGVSGGKDSLTLLHLLVYAQRVAPINFELAACTVDPQTEAYQPEPLIAYFKLLNIPYFFESQAIIDEAKKLSPRSICSYCARMKRGVLYSTCRREGYNVLALGQHLDDLAESLVMSLFHNGAIRTMKASYYNEAGDIRIIRPLLNTREKQTKEFAMKNHLPVISDNCPACFEIPKERKRIKTLLSTQEQLHPQLFSNLQTAMKPLLTGIFDTRIKSESETSGANKSKNKATTTKHHSDIESSNTKANNPPQLNISIRQCKSWYKTLKLDSVLLGFLTGISTSLIAWSLTWQARRKL